mmetsp:Transcript_22906/g.63304  ORF Transcript_22906/g.63304 Transcript_22906/m.63304 type:complete len:126 (+) Transcript_22906:2606-2983(+)
MQAVSTHMDEQLPEGVREYPLWMLCPSWWYDLQVQKLVHVEDALASNCTCMLCLEVLKHPITCVPGGHTYCKACFEDKNYECEECGKQVTQTVRNTALEAICSKFEFKQQALLAIQKAINKASSE